MNIYILLFTTLVQGLWLNSDRGFNWLEQYDADGYLSNTTDSLMTRSVPIPNSSELSISAVATNLHSHLDIKYPYTNDDGKQLKATTPGWAIRLSGSDTITVRLSSKQDVYNDYANPVSYIEIKGTNVATEVIKVKGDYKSDKQNLFKIQRTDNRLSLSVGHSSTTEQWSATLPEDFDINKIEIILDPAAALKLDYLHIDYSDTPPDDTRAIADINEAITSSGDPFAGYWTVTGRALDEKSIRMGGNYTLAMTPPVNGIYTLYYIDGATVNPSKWTDAKPKAKMRQVVHPRYDVTWIDAEGATIDDAVAIFIDDRTLKIYFPYYDADITLQRIPTPVISNDESGVNP